MTTLVTLENIQLAYGLEALLDKVKLQINQGERACLIGRNGAGKSSLLKIVEGTLLPDSGSVWRKPNLRIARLSQELPQNLNLSVFEFVAQGLAETGKLLAQYHTLITNLPSHASQKELSQLEQLQEKIHVQNGWHFEQNIKAILSRLDLNATQTIAELSGGWQRRAALAQALVSSPELLLLDEPTNHLDIAAIEWLENELLNCGAAILCITHDRALLQRLATTILELDRGVLTSWPGDYQNFLRRKEELLHAEKKQQADFDKKLAQEEQWIRQGIKARRTRNEGRVRALEAMRLKRSKRRELQAKAVLNFNEAEQSGELVIEANSVTHYFAAHDQPVIKNFSIRMMRGDRIGLIGPNGIGKSTLLNIFLGNITPQQGTVKQGTKLKIAYFDQLRSHLDLEKSVLENVSHGKDVIEINGKKKHIISYLNDFLFTPTRALTPVKALSGGECNRLLLARLFSQPANLLVMDEPTNDLDIETLELLEELLVEFPGTLLLVSHDRAFLDNVVTSLLVFHGQGEIQETIGGYSDLTKVTQIAKPKTEEKISVASTKDNKVKLKLSYKEQKELNEFPDKIEKLETLIQELQTEIASNEFYKQPANMVNEKLTKLKNAEIELQHSFQRWEELESLLQQKK